MRFFLLGAATVLATAVSGASPARAVPISTLYDTGVSNSGTPLANNAAELHYTLVSQPGGLSYGVRVATAANGFPIPPWLGDNSTSAWIGPNSDAALDGPVGNYDYRTTFDLTGLIAATAAITGQWSVDNTGIDILLNGVSTGNTAGGFTSFTPFSLTSGFVSGVNTLDFIVYNGGGPTGLRVEMSGAANVAPASVPEPASLALLGAMLAGCGLLRRRHGVSQPS